MSDSTKSVLQFKLLSRRQLKQLLIVALSFTSLYVGFDDNLWKIADGDWLRDHRFAMEGSVLGRIVKSRQDGIFSSGALLGFGSTDEVPAKFSGEGWAAQKTAYIESLRFNAYLTYNSHNGGQGLLLSVIDRYLQLSPAEKLRIYSSANSFLLALTITTLILWFCLEFGLLVSVFALASALLSKWLIVFSTNLYWFTWAFYVPMLAVLFYLRYSVDRSIFQYLYLGGIVFLTLFLKCLLNGYEYITTSILMMMVPIVYYGINYKCNLFKGLLTAVIGSGVALIVSLSLLSIQIAAVKDSIVDGIDHVVTALLRRTHGNPQLLPLEVLSESREKTIESLEINTIDVVLTYLRMSYFDANQYFSEPHEMLSRFLNLRYIDLVILLIVVTIFIVFSHRHTNHANASRRRSKAFLLASWFSLLAPLSWIVLFKAHSFLHTFMNPIVWQMPFIFFVFAIFGFIVKSIYRDCALRARNLYA